MQINKDNKYLLTYLVALLVLTMCLWFISISAQTLSYIILGFCWNFTIHAPSLRERLGLKKYRFSLLRFIFGVDKFLCSFSERFYIRMVLRSTPAVIFSFLCFLISLEGIFIASLLGSLFFEAIFNGGRILKLIKCHKADL